MKTPEAGLAGPGPSDYPGDRTAAERVAQVVRENSGRRGGWFEVRELMGEFGIERFSDQAQIRITQALTDVGLTAQPPLNELDRSETVVLSGADSDGEDSRTDTVKTLSELMSVRIANAGQRLENVPLSDLHTRSLDGAVRWFNVSDSARLRDRDVVDHLGPYCNNEVTLEMASDLLSPDPRPKIKAHEGDIRCVSAFKVRACESDEGAHPGSASKAGVLLFEPVEFLVGRDWLISCWHDVEVYRGAERIRESPPAAPAQLFEEIVRCWPGPDLRTAGDLALLVLRELALSYAPAYRQFEVWQEEWELDFYRRPDRIDRETLLEVRAAAAVLRDWLSPLNPSGMRQDISRAWFPGITGSPAQGGHQIALNVDDRIDGALAGLRDFTGTLRSAYDLLQLREGERERERDDKFQRNIAVGGSAILIPTLVAGIMGANTWVPGQWKEPGGPPHWAFLALVGFVILSGVVAWVAIHRLQARDDAAP